MCPNSRDYLYTIEEIDTDLSRCRVRKWKQSTLHTVKGEDQDPPLRLGLIDTKGSINLNPNTKGMNNLSLFPSHLQL